MKDGTVKVLAVATVLAFMCMAFACIDANNSNGNNVNKITPVGSTSGTDGGIDWNYDEDSCTLTISPSAHPKGELGPGAMEDYSSDHVAPWVDEAYSFGDNCNLVVESGVVTIGAHAFYSLVIGDVTLPDTVTSIGPYAFASCSIKSLTTSAKVIDSYAFFDCRCLSGDLDLSKTDYIGKCAFEYCEKLGNVTIGASFIDEGAFSGCKNIEKVTIGASQIGVRSFEGCENLKEICFTNEHIEYIYDLAFGCCSFLTDISFEAVKDIQYIDPCAFGLDMHFLDRDFSPITDLLDLHGKVFTGIAGTMWQCN